MKLSPILIGISITIAFQTGRWYESIARRPPVMAGVQTWYEPSYVIPGVGRTDASIRHNVWPDGKSPYNSLHSLNYADDCGLCQGKGKNWERAK